MGKSNAGQITGFIVLGLVVILLLVFVQAFLSNWTKIKPGLIYPKEAQPIANHITDCVTLLGQEAVEIMGSQGGWIEIPAVISSDIRASMPLDLKGNQRLPYWHYQGEVRIPTQEGMERQIAKFIETNLKSCMTNLTQFGMDVEELGNISAQSVIADNEVLIQVTYPLRLTAPGLELTVDKYQTSLQVKLKQLYDLAYRITLFEIEHQYLENMTVDLMSANKDIPFSNMEAKCTESTWQNVNIQKITANMLAANIQNIRVANTAHEPFLASQSVYESLRDANKGLQADLNAGLEDLKKSKSYPKDTPADAYQYFHQYINAGDAPSDSVVAFQYSPE